MLTRPDNVALLDGNVGKSTYASCASGVDELYRLLIRSVAASVRHRGTDCKKLPSGVHEVICLNIILLWEGALLMHKDLQFYVDCVSGRRSRNPAKKAFADCAMVCQNPRGQIAPGKFEVNWMLTRESFQIGAKRKRSIATET